MSKNSRTVNALASFAALHRKLTNHAAAGQKAATRCHSRAATARPAARLTQAERDLLPEYGRVQAHLLSLGMSIHEVGAYLEEPARRKALLAEACANSGDPEAWRQTAAAILARGGAPFEVLADRSEYETNPVTEAGAAAFRQADGRSAEESLRKLMDVWPGNKHLIE